MNSKNNSTQLKMKQRRGVSQLIKNVMIKKTNIQLFEPIQMALQVITVLKVEINLE